MGCVASRVNWELWRLGLFWEDDHRVAVLYNEEKEVVVASHDVSESLNCGPRERLLVIDSFHRHGCATHSIYRRKQIIGAIEAAARCYHRAFTCNVSTSPVIL